MGAGCRFPRAGGGLIGLLGVWGGLQRGPHLWPRSPPWAFPRAAGSRDVVQTPPAAGGEKQQKDVRLCGALPQIIAPRCRVYAEPDGQLFRDACPFIGFTLSPPPAPALPRTRPHREDAGETKGFGSESGYRKLNDSLAEKY